MTLVWKLLRRHIAPAQLLGFFLSNLIGLTIIMLAVQAYTDARTLARADDLLMRSDYLILNKPVGTLSTLARQAPTFSKEEIDELASQPWLTEVGQFTAATFDAKAQFDMPSFGSFSTDIFFEAVPDAFLDVPTAQWVFSPDSAFIPLILPRSYLDLYNFGFAASRQMPPISEGLFVALKLRVYLRGNGHGDWYDARVIGFSNRLQTILVPQSCLDYANRRYGTAALYDNGAAPSRLIARLNNPADARISTFLQTHNYETDADKLTASKTNYLLHLALSLVIAIGALISLLSIYILMLSIYLLVEKNSEKLQTLLLLGYSTRRVALPYQLLALLLNVVVALLSAAVLIGVRSAYLLPLEQAFPQADFPPAIPALLVGAAVVAVAAVLNALAIHRKIRPLWKH